jgi:hypothetical protein
MSNTKPNDPSNEGHKKHAGIFVEEVEAAKHKASRAGTKVFWS